MASHLLDHVTLIKRYNSFLVRFMVTRFSTVGLVRDNNQFQDSLMDTDEVMTLRSCDFEKSL